MFRTQYPSPVLAVEKTTLTVDKSMLTVDKSPVRKKNKLKLTQY